MGSTAFESVIKASKGKAKNLSEYPIQYMIRSTFAGMAIFFGLTYSNVVSASNGKFAGAIVFSLGLLLIIFLKGELFTGNVAVMNFGGFNGEVKFRHLIGTLFTSYIFNFFGCAIATVYFILSNTPGAEEAYKTIAANKINLEPTTALWRAVCCNVFVCLAVFLGIILKEEVAKIIMVTLCISAFIMCGFEHCIANMGVYLIDACYKNLNFIEFIKTYWKPLAIVTIGNIFGGFVIAFIVYLCLVNMEE